MSTGAGTFEHYRTFNGSVCRKITTRPVVERIRPPATPRKHESDAMLGRWVRTTRARTIAWGSAFEAAGQVWSAAPTDAYGSGCYWIATDNGFVVAHESSMVELAPRCEDVPLFGEEMAS